MYLLSKFEFRTERRTPATRFSYSQQTLFLRGVDCQAETNGFFRLLPYEYTICTNAVQTRLQNGNSNVADTTWSLDDDQIILYN